MYYLVHHSSYIQIQCILCTYTYMHSSLPLYVKLEAITRQLTNCVLHDVHTHSGGHGQRREREREDPYTAGNCVVI